MIRLLLVILVLLSAPLAARAEDDDTDVSDWRQRIDAQAVWNSDQPAIDGALGAPLMVCSGTACADRTILRLADGEAEAIRELFAQPAADAAQERALIARAIALMETYVGVKNGTWADHPRNHHAEDEPGQLDCVSEAGNTRSYLDRLEAEGMLRFHRVEGWALRYVVLLQHVAVEITEIDTGDGYVVDSWGGANGEPPQIDEYLRWRMEWLAMRSGKDAPPT